MITTNYRHHPDALMLQRELELVFAVPEAVSADEFELIKRTFDAAGEFIRRYAVKAQKTKQAPPTWWTAAKRRARALAQAVRAALAALF